MTSLDLFLPFLVTTGLFAFLPGPAMLYVAARTVAANRRAGLMATLGIHLGGYVHVAAAAAGLSVLFQAVPAAYMVVKLAGAAYLVYLGIAMVRTPTRKPGDNGIPALGAAITSARRAFLQSMMVEVLNPKTAIFFLAFLPQFVDPAATVPIALQFAVLGTIVNMMFSLADIVCVLLADAVLARLRTSGRAERLMQKIGGTVLVGLGVHVALGRA
ncbi:amino acid transporter [Rhizobium sp. Leaf384]|uniref:LysE family translocator n=1 Tax=unclassified Rhizobium TaxID=2613769 RepID=UPI0007143D36|nr:MULTISPECIES: LysE family translocator [unclassified Rhizobium]KQS77613.1 amino acid transporter [Rhizobium sp. Leaf384]KQS83733.1 amino acid transporter [Rhizobium sp. Leaf383]